jgi:hypothetical protein
MKQMSFRDWIIKTKLQHKGAVGDLCRDIYFDEAAKNVPNTLEAWRGRLKNSPDYILTVLTQAWRQYEKAVKRAATTRVEGFATPEAVAQPIERR